MERYLKQFSFVAFFFFLLSQHAFAEVSVADALAKNNVDGKNICSSIQKSIQQEINAKDVVKTAIKLGHSACLVVKCAIAGGGKLADVIPGAIEAGATPDVISRCAIDAGAEASGVAEILSTCSLGPCYFVPDGLGYSSSEGGGVISTGNTLPGEGNSTAGNGQPVSPSAF
jgi:hypothetical protein